MPHWARRVPLLLLAPLQTNLVSSEPFVMAGGFPTVNGVPAHFGFDAVLEKLRDLRREPLLSPEERRAAMLESSWADGLRGLASLFVVSSHLVLCFARRLVLPCCGALEGVQMLWQKPVFRLIAQGHSWVALFFVLSGFVNALKPVRQARAGQPPAALAGLASAAFKRPFRLMLPAAAATAVSWVLCQLGLYELARNGDAYWLYAYTPAMSPSWGTALEDLMRALRQTWTLQSINAYDQPQWALIYLLLGSMMTFIALLMTVNLAPAWRMASLAALALWSFDWSYKFRDPIVGFTFLSGIILAELSLTDLPARLAPLSPLLSPPLVLLGLVLMSHPSDRPDLAPWSKALQALGARLFPRQIDLGRTWGSVGCLLLIAGILVSPHARRALSHPALAWLGRVSFPVYLLHGTFMRSVLAWLVFAGQALRPFEAPGPDGKNITVQRYPQPGELRIIVSLVVSMGCMLLASHWWAARVEPIFGRITKAVEDVMTSKKADGMVVGRGSPGRPVLPVRNE